MRPQGPHIEDKLLDFAYGELPPPEREEVQSHLEACPACSEALDSIQGVRRVMSRLPQETAPDTGLESLLGYAQQAARRASAGPAPKKGIRMWLIPALGLGVAGVVVALVASPIRKAVSIDELAASAPHEAPPAPVVAAAPVASPTPAPAAPAGSAATKTALADKFVGTFGGAPKEDANDVPAPAEAENLGYGDLRKASEHRPVAGAVGHKDAAQIVTATPLHALGQGSTAGADDAKALSGERFARGPEQKARGLEGERRDQALDVGTGRSIAKAKEAPPKDLAEKQELARDIGLQGGAANLEAPADGNDFDRGKSGNKGSGAGGYAGLQQAPEPAAKAPQIVAKNESSMSNAVSVAPSTPPATAAAPPAPPPARVTAAPATRAHSAPRSEPAPQPVVASREEVTEVRKKSDSAADESGAEPSESRFQTLDRKARQLHAQNDWAGEERTLRQALAQPEAKDPEVKGDLLSRLCEAQDNQGGAGSACQRIATEFPNTHWDAAWRSRRASRSYQFEDSTATGAHAAPAKKASERKVDAPASSESAK